MKLKLVLILAAFASVLAKEKFNQRITNFSFELLYFTALETDAHTVVSPSGIWTLMTAVAQGAEDASYEQLARALYLPKSEKELSNGYKLFSEQIHKKSNGVKLKENNFMFTDKRLQVIQEFRNTLRNSFNTYTIPLDFTQSDISSAKANELINKATDGQIKEALFSTDFNDAQMILTNVIHFNGQWQMPFNTTDTKLEPFYDNNGDQIGQVNMMSQRAPFPFTNMRSIGAFILEAPYGDDGRFSMLIILPYIGNKVLDMYRKFANVTLSEILAQLQRDQEAFGDEDVDFSLPRFKISTNVVLNKPLHDMGVYDIFDPARANLKRMTNQEVYVSKVVHKAEIEVTETGTVASAITSATISNRNPPADFKVNRPFLYLIMEKTSSAVLFGGIYSKPSVF